MNETQPLTHFDLIGDMNKLRHMLGVDLSRPSSKWCYRNYYNTSTDQDASMLRLVSAGYAERYAPCYFRATEAGMRLIGLNDRQIKKAMEP